MYSIWEFKNKIRDVIWYLGCFSLCSSFSTPTHDRKLRISSQKFLQYVEYLQRSALYVLKACVRHPGILISSVQCPSRYWSRNFECKFVVNRSVAWYLMTLILSITANLKSFPLARISRNTAFMTSVRVSIMVLSLSPSRTVFSAFSNS